MHLQGSFVVGQISSSTAVLEPRLPGTSLPQRTGVLVSEAANRDNVYSVTHNFGHFKGKITDGGVVSVIKSSR